MVGWCNCGTIFILLIFNDGRRGPVTTRVMDSYKFTFSLILIGVGVIFALRQIHLNTLDFG